MFELPPPTNLTLSSIFEAEISPTSLKFLWNSSAAKKISHQGTAKWRAVPLLPNAKFISARVAVPFRTLPILAVRDVGGWLLLDVKVTCNWETNQAGEVEKRRVASKKKWMWWYSMNCSSVWYWESDIQYSTLVIFNDDVDDVDQNSQTQIYLAKLQLYSFPYLSKAEKLEIQEAHSENQLGDKILKKQISPPQNPRNLQQDLLKRPRQKPEYLIARWQLRSHSRFLMDKTSRFFEKKTRRVGLILLTSKQHCFWRIEPWWQRGMRS